MRQASRASHGAVHMARNTLFLLLKAGISFGLIAWLALRVDLDPCHRRAEVIVVIAVIAVVIAVVVALGECKGDGERKGHARKKASRQHAKQEVELHRDSLD